jgi:hypothetical protein
MLAPFLLVVLALGSPPSTTVEEILDLVARMRRGFFGWPATQIDQIRPGRDAADVAISITFGAAQLAHFSVITEELGEENTSGVLAPKQALPEAADSLQFA